MQTTKVPAVQRNVVVRMKSGRRTEHETGAAHAVDHRRLLRLIHLATQPAHMHIDEIRVRDETIVPYLLEEHGAGHHLALAAYHVLEEPELAREQIDAAVAALRRTLDEIELERTHPQRRLAALGRPAQQRLKPRHELDECERLGEIVIAAGAKPTYPVVDRAERAQDQNRRANLPPPQGLDNRETIDFRKQPVDDDDVMRGGSCFLQSRGSGRRP